MVPGIALSYPLDDYFVVRPDACAACGHCVTACPERAIKLVKVVA